MCRDGTLRLLDRTEAFTE